MGAPVHTNAIVTEKRRERRVENFNLQLTVDSSQSWAANFLEGSGLGDGFGKNHGAVAGIGHGGVLDVRGEREDNVGWSGTSRQVRTRTPFEP
jgi:hypothetical protein